MRDTPVRRSLRPEHRDAQRQDHETQRGRELPHGGADARKGSGLIGLKDRVEVLGGNLTIASPPGSGTSLCITIPVTS